MLSAKSLDAREPARTAIVSTQDAREAERDLPAHLAALDRLIEKQQREIARLCARLAAISGGAAPPRDRSKTLAPSADLLAWHPAAATTVARRGAKAA
ncbi:MAG: hypothetical protein ACT4QC_13800 [Planctomycetaceae bacterium]